MPCWTCESSLLLSFFWEECGTQPKGSERIDIKVDDPINLWHVCYNFIVNEVCAVKRLLDVIDQMNQFLIVIVEIISWNISCEVKRKYLNNLNVDKLM